MTRHLRVRERFESLALYGVAAEHFPRYVNPTLSPHTLDCVLLTLVVRGSGRHVLGDEAVTESPGSLTVTHYGQAHDLVTDPEGMEVLNLYLDPERHALPRLPEPLGGRLRGLVPIHPNLYHRFNRRVRLTLTEAEPVFALVREIALESATARPGQRAALEALLAAALVRICRQVPPMAAPGSDGLGAAERVRRRLDAAFAESQSLDELAREAGMSPTSLCRAFRRATGRTVGEYLAQRRVEAVAHGLRSGREKIAVLAIRSGFTDLAQFNRTFRRLMGETPSAYRSRWSPE